GVGRGGQGGIRCSLVGQGVGGPTLQGRVALMLVAVSFSLAAQKLYGG
ncbi:sulfite exporter TauE/SafE family protein, partial [Pseudomonas aeruginosa]|nr:sulfite exporter TauE/SafE family protein [Pseudomonas aeruginosa]